MESLHSIHHSTLLVTWRISIISSIEKMECFLSNKCKFRFFISMFIIEKIFFELYIKSLSVCPVYFLLQSEDVN